MALEVLKRHLLTSSSPPMLLGSGMNEVWLRWMMKGQIWYDWCIQNDLSFRSHFQDLFLGTNCFSSYFFVCIFRINEKETLQQKPSATAQLPSAFLNFQTDPRRTWWGLVLGSLFCSKGVPLFVSQKNNSILKRFKKNLEFIYIYLFNFLSTQKGQSLLHLKPKQNSKNCPTPNQASSEARGKRAPNPPHNKN